MLTSKMMKKVAKNDAARALMAKLQAFEPVNKDAVLFNAAKNTKGLVDSLVIYPMSDILYDHSPATEALERPFTSQDAKNLNSIVNLLNEYSDIPKKGFTGAMKVIAEIIAPEKELRKKIKAARKNFPNGVAFMLSGISELIIAALAETVRVKTRAVSYGADIDSITYHLFMEKLMKQIENIPVECYQALLGMVLDEQLEDIAENAAYDMSYCVSNDMKEGKTRDSIIAMKEVQAKRRILEAYENIDPRSHQNSQEISKMSAIIKKLFSVETITKVFEILNKPANESIEESIKALEDLEKKTDENAKEMKDDMDILYDLDKVEDELAKASTSNY